MGNPRRIRLALVSQVCLVGAIAACVSSADAQRPRFITPAAGAGTPVPQTASPPVTTYQYGQGAGGTTASPDPFAIQLPNQVPPAAIQPPQLVEPGLGGYPPNQYVPINPPGVSPYQQVVPDPMLWQQPAPVQPWPDSYFAWPSQAWARLRSNGIPRLLQRPRFRYTFISGGSDINDVGMNSAELATTLTIPNFLFTQQPIRISPGFIFNFVSGPIAPPPNALPSKLYDAYLSTDYTTPWDQRLGGEINFTVGVYSDFNQVTHLALRYTGVGLGWWRITPTTTVKVGVEYLDRVDIKLLPAIGVFLEPTPDVRFNVYFPRPKLAHRIPSVGNVEMWLYLAGEYGGGSWEISQPVGSDQVDINDVRVYGGLEWTGPRGVTGFFEAGYVFERELIFRSVGVPYDLRDAAMLRAGIAF